MSLPLGSREDGWQCKGGRNWNQVISLGLVMLAWINCIVPLEHPECTILNIICSGRPEGYQFITHTTLRVYYSQGLGGIGKLGVVEICFKLRHILAGGSAVKMRRMGRVDSKIFGLLVSIKISLLNVRIILIINEPSVYLHHGPARGAPRRKLSPAKSIPE